jgi:hypothetical protein
VPVPRLDRQPVRAHYEVIRNGEAGKPTEFGKMVKLQEAENQIVSAYEVYNQRPSDQDILMAAIETQQARTGRTPHLAAADVGFYQAKTRPPQRPVERIPASGTAGSNPTCSSSESVSPVDSGAARAKCRAFAAVCVWVGT